MQLGQSASHALTKNLKIAAFICVPLIRDAQWRFALCLYRSAPCHWREDEVALAVEVTARVWTRLERLRTEAALRQSERRYRTLFESIDEGFCIIEQVKTPAGESIDFVVVEANPAAVRQTGVSTLVGKTLREQFPRTFEAWYAVYESVLRNGQPTRLEREVQDIGRVVEACVFRIEHDTTARLALVFKDITARKRAEQTLRASAQTMVDLDRRKDEFLAMLCHELRNPLASIASAVQFLRLHPSDDPLQQQATHIIDRQVRQLTYLVDELLDISRINTGRVQLGRQTVALSDIVERALETACPLIDQRGHELTVSLPPQPVWLEADPFRLEQVVVNLLTNAAKYTDEGGRIELRVEQEDAQVVLRVRDTGIGIASELLPHIFDLFTQAQRSLDRSQGGLGIGLSLVQRLVELHGGTVQAHSVLGHGSEFVVRLPVLQDFTPPSPGSVPSARTAPPSGPGCRVLVVDDNVDLARSLAMLLEMSGHQVRTAHDGPSALEAALDERPDAVLLDIGLPGFDGFEVAKRMRQQPRLQGVVLVAMTGYGQAADRQRSHEAGFDHHLVKPADFDAVQNILATVSQNAA